MAEDLHSEIVIGTRSIEEAEKKAKELERKVEAIRKGQLAAEKQLSSEIEKDLKQSYKKREIDVQEYAKRVEQLELDKAKKIEAINERAINRQITINKAAMNSVASDNAATSRTIEQRRIDVETRVEAVRRASINAEKVRNSQLESDLKRSLKNREIDHQTYIQHVADLEQRKASQIAAINARADSRLQRAGVVQPGAPSSPGGLNAPAINFSAITSGFTQVIGLVRSFGSVLKESADVADAAQDSFERLERWVGAKLGQEAVPAAKKAFEDLTKNGIFDHTQAAKSIADLVKLNFTVEQAKTLIDAYTDSAYQNGKAGKSVAENVNVATGALLNNKKSGGEAIGINEKLGVTLKNLGTSHAELSSKSAGAAARQAFVNDQLQKVAPFAGAAARELDTYSGIMEQLAGRAHNAQAGLGEVVQKGFVFLGKEALNVIDQISEVSEEFKKTEGGAKTLLVFFKPLVTLLALTWVTIKTLITGLIELARGIAKVVQTVEGNKAFQTFLYVIGLLIDKVIALGVAIKGKLLGVLSSFGDSESFFTTLSDALTLIFDGILKLGAAFLSLKDIAVGVFESMILGFKALGYAAIGNLGAAGKAFDEAKVAMNTAVFTGENFVAKTNIQFEKWKKGAAEASKSVSASVRQRDAGSSGNVNPSVKARGEAEVMVAEQTRLEKLEQDRQYLEDRKALNKTYFEQAEIDKELEATNKEIELITEQTKENDFQNQKLALVKRYNNAKTKEQRQQIQTEIKLKNIEIESEYKKVQIIGKLDKASAEERKNLATDVFDAGEALLSKEKGSFLKFLGDKLKAYTKAKATELFIEATAALVTAPWAAPGLFLASAAVFTAGQLGGEFISSLGASEENANGPAQVGEKLPEATNPETLSNNVSKNDVVNSTSNVTNVYNTTNYNTEVKEQGTYVGEEQWVKKVLLPHMQSQALEQGTVLFKRSG